MYLSGEHSKIAERRVFSVLVLLPFQSFPSAATLWHFQCIVIIFHLVSHSSIAFLSFLCTGGITEYGCCLKAAVFVLLSCKES